MTLFSVMSECQHIHPFPEMTGSHHEEHGRPDAIPNGKLRSTQIAAILVWTSPRDWCLDLQVVTDLLLSDGGVIGTRAPTNGDEDLPNCGFQRGGQPRLYFCNPDFEWSTEHAHPRLAQGAFCKALAGLWRHMTRGRAELEYELVGKPTEPTYRYGERVLREYAAAELGGSVDTVYMIGDNPESDIVGANSFRSQHGIKWESVLVETGVYTPGTTPLHEPLHTARDVTDAVKWALRREGIVFTLDTGYYTPPPTEEALEGGET